MVAAWNLAHVIISSMENGRVAILPEPVENPLQM
jgi:hypothetical protein